MKVKDEYARSSLDYDMVMKWANETAASKRLQYFDHDGTRYVTDGAFLLWSAPDLLRGPVSRAIEHQNPDMAAKSVLPVLRSRRVQASWVENALDISPLGVQRRIVLVRDMDQVIPCVFDDRFCSVLTSDPPIVAIRMTKRIRSYKPYHYPIVGGGPIQWLLMPMFLHQYQRDQLLINCAMEPVTGND